MATGKLDDFQESLCFCKIAYDSSCKFVFGALFFRRGSENSNPHPTRGLTIPSARAGGGRQAGYPGADGLGEHGFGGNVL